VQFAKPKDTIKITMSYPLFFISSLALTGLPMLAMKLLVHRREQISCNNDWRSCKGNESDLGNKLSDEVLKPQHTTAGKRSNRANNERL